jgi:heme/copper-type cytochrome/quinol oxidase subunit 1
MDAARASREPSRSNTGEEGINLPVFEQPPALTRFLDQTEEAIRQRLARLRLFDRVFLLERDWMTRITVLMIILALFWGAVGGFDIFSFQTQVVGYVSQSSLHLSDVEIYSSVTLHGLREFFGFVQQLEMATLGFLLINALGLVPRHKWSLYLSVGLVNASILLLEGPVYLAPFNDNYFPAVGWYFLSPLGVAGHSAYVVSPLFFLGWLSLSAGVLLWTGWMVVHLRDWFRRTRVAPSGLRLPAFLWFLLATVVLTPVTYVPLVISTLWDMGSAYGGWPLSALSNQVVFWIFGHSIVYLLFLLPLVSLYFLIPILARRPVYSYRFAVVSALLFIVLTPMLGLHHLYLTPLPGWATWLTMALSFAIVVPSAITFFSLWMTLKGVPAGEWEWNAVALFALLSMGGMVFGGLTGPVLATQAWDVDLHNSLFVLSHFHAITVLGIAGGGFALLYAVFPILSGRQWFSATLARLHFVGTAVGGVTLVIGMDDLGSLGILRRQVILPVLPVVTVDQWVLFGGIVVVLLAQLFLVANGFLTVFKGELYSAAGLSFDEAVRRAAQSTCPRPRRVPVKDVPFVRRVPRARRERIEKVWIGTVGILLVLVLVAATPGALGVSQTIDNSGSGPSGTEFVTLYAQQYYWTVNETGPIHGSFNNTLVAYAGQWVALNMTAGGATQSLYIPFRSQAPVNVQVVPGSLSHALFQAPSVPGVYGAPDGEYDGPWFGQNAAALIVLPAPSADPFPTLSSFQSAGGAGDLYDPPVMPAARAALVANGEGLFNFSVPGPTLEAQAPSGGGPVSFSWTIPLSSIGINNYLVNDTSLAPNAQEQWVEQHNDTLPYGFRVLRLDPTVGLETVSQGPLRVGSLQVEDLTLTPGVYLYGVTRPVSYTYDPNGESTGQTGFQYGSVMGLWGVLWVGAS